jgi:hypothetical protein
MVDIKGYNFTLVIDVVNGVLCSFAQSVKVSFGISYLILFINLQVILCVELCIENGSTLEVQFIVDF